MHLQGEQSRVDEFSSLPVLSGAPLPTWTRRLTVSPLPTICRQTAGSPSLRCQGCSHPPRHHPEAALSSTDLLRQDCGEGLSPPRITAPHGANRKCANISFAHEFLKHHVPQRKLVSRAVLSIAMPIVMWILGRPIATPPKEFFTEFDVPDEVRTELFYDSTEACRSVSSATVSSTHGRWLASSC